MIAFYGVRKGDTIKKARVRLDADGFECAFHDYKEDGADPARLAAWSEAVSCEVLLKRRGTTFRALSDAGKADIDRARALRLMRANPLLTRRQVTGSGAMRWPGSTWTTRSSARNARCRWSAPAAQR